MILNNKGGVGKTILSAILAEEKSLKNRKVLCIDTDPQGNLSYAFGIEPGNGGLGKMMLFPERNSLNSIETSTWWEGAPIDVIGSGHDLDNMEFRPHALAEGLRILQQHYDEIIVDTPPSLSAITGSGISEADRVIIPTQPSRYSIRGIESVLDFIDKRKKQKDPDISVLVTMFDGRINDHTHNLEMIRNNFPFAGILKRCSRISSNVEGHQLWKKGIMARNREAYCNVLEKLI